MKQIIDETVNMAYGYLAAFGFTKVQVDTLVTQGQKELSTTLDRFVTLLMSGDTYSSHLEEINGILHALQGLFSQLGNEEIAVKLYEIEDYDTLEDRLVDISTLLGLPIPLDIKREKLCRSS